LLQGLFEEAKRDYLELLRRTPTDFGALNDFGTLALTAGYKDAARSLFNEAVRDHPDNPNGIVRDAGLLLVLGQEQDPQTLARRPDVGIVDQCGQVTSQCRRGSAFAAAPTDGQRDGRRSCLARACGRLSPFGRSLPEIQRLAHGDKHGAPRLPCLTAEDCAEEGVILQRVPHGVEFTHWASCAGVAVAWGSVCPTLP